MKIKYSLLILLGVFLTLSSCKSDDDDGSSSSEEVPRDEQQVIDNDKLLDYLESHYYNSGQLQALPNASISDVVITKLDEGEVVPSEHTLLIDGVGEAKETVYLETDYEYYVLNIKQGEGDESPNFSDLVRLNYQGFLLDKDPNDLSDSFDSTVNPVDFDLISLIKGWSLVIPEFNIADGFIENGDGTISYINPGVGIMFLPSGLGYYSVARPSIPAYSPLIFKFEVFQTKINDHDSDGIPSFVEDLDGNLDVADDDTDGDTFGNFIDPDDDGDGVPTKDELEPKKYVINIGDPDPVFGAKEFEVSRSVDEENDEITINTVTIVDTDNNNIDDYLDEGVTTNYNED
jgi:FKBP-type peptidyl-prolyl cis-trans isomerase